MDQHRSGETGSGLELQSHACGRRKLAHIAAFKIAKWPEMWRCIHSVTNKQTQEVRI